MRLIPAMDTASYLARVFAFDHRDRDGLVLPHLLESVLEVAHLDRQGRDDPHVGRSRGRRPRHVRPGCRNDSDSHFTSLGRFCPS